MQLEAKKYRFDIQQAASRLAEFTGGRTLDTYVADAMGDELAVHVECHFECH